MPADAASQSLGQRLLAPIADDRRDGVVSVLMTLIMFLILAAYYLLTTARAQQTGTGQL